MVPIPDEKAWVDELWVVPLPLRLKLSLTFFSTSPWINVSLTYLVLSLNSLVGAGFVCRTWGEGLASPNLKRQRMKSYSHDSNIPWYSHFRSFADTFQLHFIPEFLVPLCPGAAVAFGSNRQDSGCYGERPRGKQGGSRMVEDAFHRSGMITASQLIEFVLLLKLLLLWYAWIMIMDDFSTDDVTIFLQWLTMNLLMPIMLMFIDDECYLYSMFLIDEYRWWIFVQKHFTHTFRLGVWKNNKYCIHISIFGRASKHGGAMYIRLRGTSIIEKGRVRRCPKQSLAALTPHMAAKRPLSRGSYFTRCNSWLTNFPASQPCSWEILLVMSDGMLENLEHPWQRCNTLATWRSFLHIFPSTQCQGHSQISLYRSCGLRVQVGT